jgi:WhiB family redox-sensing transcriptional regulator
MKGNRNPRPGAAAEASRPDLGWQDAAACKGEDTELFFSPEIERPLDQLRREAQAKAICGRCPVWRNCLEYRLKSEHQRDGGIWGGLDEQQRWSLRKRRVRAAAAKRRVA